jgi:hypothetical protein
LGYYGFSVFRKGADPYSLRLLIRTEKLTAAKKEKYFHNLYSLLKIVLFTYWFSAV